MSKRFVVLFLCMKSILIDGLALLFSAPKSSGKRYIGFFGGYDPFRDEAVCGVGVTYAVIRF